MPLENKKLEAIRDGFGRGLLKAAQKDEKIVALCADVEESTRCREFAEKFPDRFIEVGVAEQNMATIASGLANYGKIPFICSYAVFSPGRNWEQIRTTICINDVPVKIAGHHAGVTVGPDGATHQALEDIALMRALPNMTVIVPADAIEAEKATIAAAQQAGPVYLRLCRQATALVTKPLAKFEIGKADILRPIPKNTSATKGKLKRFTRRVALIACGIEVAESLKAADILAKEGIEAMVINCHTLKPLDETTIISAAKKCGAVITAEEHQIAGGLGSAVAELLSENYPVPLIRVGVKDRFGTSGKAIELLYEYGLNAGSIAQAAKSLVKLLKVKILNK